MLIAAPRHGRSPLTALAGAQGRQDLHLRHLDLVGGVHRAEATHSHHRDTDYVLVTRDTLAGAKAELLEAGWVFDA